MRLVVGVVLASVLGALAVAFVSRTPAHVREAPRHEPAPASSARFTDEQIARHAAFRGPGYLALLLTTVVELGLLVALARGPWGAIVRWSERVPGGIPGRAAVLGLVIAAALAAVVLPIAFVRGHVIARAWGLSTQTSLSWLGDQALSLAVGGIVAAVTSAVFFALLRAQPRTWWLWSWAAFTVLTAFFAFVWPVAVAPLFNRFTPLEDRSLRDRVATLTERADLDVEEVLVSDASRRGTTENAYVAGLGATKRVVLFDNLVEGADEDEVAFVVAHELGHEVEGHVGKNVALSSVGLGIALGVLVLLGRWTAFWGWFGSMGPHDLRAIPALVLVATVLGLLALPAGSAISRRFEQRADEIAVELTEQPRAAATALRRLALSNLADLRPHPVLVWALYTHPPIPDRIATVAPST